MVDISLVVIFDAKVVNNEREADWPRIVFPEPRGDWHGFVSRRSEQFFEVIIGDAASLRLYSCMITSGIMRVWMRMYSGSSNGVPR